MATVIEYEHLTFQGFTLAPGILSPAIVEKMGDEDWKTKGAKFRKQ